MRSDWQLPESTPNNMDFRFCVQKRKVPDYRVSDCKMPGLYLAFSQAVYSGVKASSTIEDERYPVLELFSRSGERLTIKSQEVGKKKFPYW